MQPGPRLFGITATDADTVAVLRRGPSDWTHVGRWHVAARSYEPGAWLNGRLYPQRCDLTPDGHYLCYLAFGGTATWSLGSSYLAVSRLPWLTALAAWGTGGTWTRGAHFVDDVRVWDLSDPDVGDVEALRGRYGMAVTRPESFPVERRRGWVETPDSQPRDATDVWDERRAEQVRIGRPRPGHPSSPPWLVAAGGFAAHRSSPHWFGPARYELRAGPAGPTIAVLDGVQWADWSRDGRLLVATSDGSLQIRGGASLDLLWEHDLADLTPDPQPPPTSARR